MAPSNFCEVYTSDNGLQVSVRDHQWCLGDSFVVYRFIIRTVPQSATRTPANPQHRHLRRLPPNTDSHTRVTNLFETVDMGGGYLYNPSWKDWTRPIATYSAHDKKEYTDPWAIWCDSELDITKVEVHTGYKAAGPWMLKYRKQQTKNDTHRRGSTSSGQASMPKTTSSTSSTQHKIPKDSTTTPLAAKADFAEPSVTAKSSRRSTLSTSSKQGMNKAETFNAPADRGVLGTAVSQKAATDGTQKKKRISWKRGLFWRK